MKPFIYRLSVILFTYILFINTSSAQNSGKISGSIIDENTKEKIDFASVALLQENTNAYVDGIQSDLNGNFMFSNLADGSYYLKITFLGYKDFEKRKIALKGGQTISLGVLSLIQDDAQVLTEVTIEGQSPTMQLGIDRKVFNVAQSVVSAGGSATDLLSDIPSLSVDMDGAVSLRGSSGVRILIDGKPSPMGGDISQLLQSMPANTIESVEVITNPSSKFEADGQSGIINIVLKKNIRTGFNGMVNVSGGSYHNYNGGLNLNYRDTRFNYFGSYNYRKGNRVGDGYNYNQSLLNNGITENSSESSRKGNSHRVKLGLDYYLNDKNTIGISGGFDTRDNNQLENIFYKYQNQPSLDGTSTRVSDRKTSDFGYDFSIDFKREFSRPGEELVGNFSFGKSTEEGSQSFDQQFSNVNQTIDSRLNDNDED